MFSGDSWARKFLEKFLFCLGSIHVKFAHFLLDFEQSLCTGIVENNECSSECENCLLHGKKRDMSLSGLLHLWLITSRVFNKGQQAVKLASYST